MNIKIMAVVAMLTATAMPVCADEINANGQPETNTGGLADSSRVYDIDEVVVVDHPKEAFRMRFQPLSSSSFSSRAIAGVHAEDLAQLSAYVPSFVMPEYGARITSSMYVRGIGSRINSPAVGIYLDGMPLQNKGAFNFHSYDFERVDFMHGPQGTLYGMNTEGGLVRMFTRNPFNYQGTDVKLSIGTRLWRNAEVSHYEKVSDKFAYSVAGFYDGQNGFLKNAYNNERADGFDEFGLRGRGIWKPSDRWTFDFMADWQNVDQDGFAYGRLLGKSDVEGAGITSPLYHHKAGDVLNPNQNRQGTYRRNTLNAGVGIKYAGSGFDFNSMTSYQWLRDNMHMDIDFLPQDYMHMNQRQLQHSMTEELSVTSRNNSFWHWTFGVFGSYSWLKTDAPVYFGSDMNKAVSNAITTAMGGIGSVNAELGPVPGLFHTPTYNAGVFHESNIELSDRITATLGLRYDYSHVAVDYATSASLAMTANVMGSAYSQTVASILEHHESGHYDQFLPKAAVTYRLDNGSNIYAVWSKGYRSGGYNIQMFSDILQNELTANARSARGDLQIAHDDATYDRIRHTIEYKPEKSYNYEVGAHLNLLDNQLHVDVATFYMQIRNQQLSVMAGNYGFGRMMTNAAKSHSTGIEVTARGAAVDNKLDYTVSYGFTSARFDEYRDSTANGNVDYKDKKVPYVPMHTLAASADYRFDIDPSALLQPSCRYHLRSVTVGLNLSAQGKTYWNESNTTSQNFYCVLGAHADGDFGPLHINVWVRNLTDTRYNTFAVESAATGSTMTFAQRGMPFQLGVDFRYHF